VRLAQFFFLVVGCVLGGVYVSSALEQCEAPGRASSWP
jgi:hypothetical protein